MTKFNGFPKGFVDFLFSLQFINTIELLPENKQVYKRLITGPLTLLFHSLAPIALSVSETIVAKPSKCVSSMYVDMRFSKTTPLKEYMYLRFREPFYEKDNLGLYFDMGCDYYGYGIRIYKQTGAGMERIREYAIKNTASFTRELKNLDRLNMAIVGEKYKKDHCPDIKNDRLKDFLNRKSFYIERACPINDAVYSAELPDEIAGAYKGLKGMYLLLKKALYGE
jgi:uncharacterized protein (DUF2461 family)